MLKFLENEKDEESVPNNMLRNYLIEFCRLSGRRLWLSLLVLKKEQPTYAAALFSEITKTFKSNEFHLRSNQKTYNPSAENQS